MALTKNEQPRGGAHVRPGRPVRRPPDTPAGAAPAPVHRAPSRSKHAGSRARASRRGVVGRQVGLASLALAVAAAVGFLVLQDRDPASRPGPDALPRATSGPAGQASPAVEPGTGTSALDPSAVPPAPELPVQDRSAVVAAAVAPDRTPEALRTALEQVLGGRAAANTVLLGAIVSGDSARATAAAEAVDATSNDLERIVAAWRPGELATQLRTAWDLQSVQGRAYATAVREGQQAAANEARAEWAASSRALGSLLEGVTGGRVASYVPAEDAAQMRSYVDSWAAGDVASAADVAEWLRGRLSREGAALAASLSGTG